MINRLAPIDCFLSARSLSSLLRISEKYSQLLLCVRGQLPESLRNRCLAVTQTGDRLTLFTSSPVWATRLRFQIPQLQRRLSLAVAISCPSISVRVTPPAQPQVTRRRPVARLSPASASTIRAIAADIDDSRLREALLRLARHTAVQ